MGEQRLRPDQLSGCHLTGKLRWNSEVLEQEWEPHWGEKFWYPVPNATPHLPPVKE